jgi:ankyrin repeat protein
MLFHHLLFLLLLLLLFLHSQASATPLQRAAAEGHVDIVHQLLKHGADVNHQDALVRNIFSKQQ